MPPRSSLTSSFSLTDANNEVVCPLRNQDGSNCRKKCLGEKRYRSMQEHIRRAHPEYYIPKLPATEESFHLMINTPPSERRIQDQNSDSATSGFHDRNSYHPDDFSSPPTPRHSGDRSGATWWATTAGAAAALTELQGINAKPVGRALSDLDGGFYSDSDSHRLPRKSIELPPLHMATHDVTSDPFSGPRRDILPSLMNTSPPERSSTLPPLQRPLGPNRARKQSISKSQHKKKNSRGSDWLRRIQNEERMRSDRKALSAEPDYGKRWEDLIDAADQAASQAGDIDDDRTPIPQSPISNYRPSLPPLAQQQQLHSSSYQASPLQQALTPPSHIQDSIDPFPSVESGDNFHIRSRGLSNSSATTSWSSQNTQIYCAACQGASLLRGSYACTECVCGLCAACVEVLMAEQGARRKCPRCATIGGRFKPFQLDIR